MPTAHFVFTLLLAGVASALHLVAVLWYAPRLGYRFFSADLSRRMQLWLLVGITVVAALPLVLANAHELIAPSLTLSAWLGLTLSAEWADGPGKPLGVVYTGFWPITAIMMLVMGGLELAGRLFLPLVV